MMTSSTALTIALALSSSPEPAQLLAQGMTSDPTPSLATAKRVPEPYPGDIIVTARRRDEALQRTPISVITLSGPDLEAGSVTNLADLQNFVPNLTLAPSQNVGHAAGNAFIRGIGQEDFIAGAEPGVAFYVDGVYLATTRGTLLNLLDIDRVEVLRGPQGTLFGRNTIGGAINLLSVKPQPDRSARFSAIAGSFQRREIRIMANEPLSDALFARLSVALIHRDGYLERLPPPLALGPTFTLDHGREGNNRSAAARLQLRWLPAQNVTADLAFDVTRARNNQGAIRIEEIDPSVGVFPTLNRLISEGKLPGPLISNELVPVDFYASYAGGRNFARNDNGGVSASLAWGWEAATLKLTLAWRKLDTWIGTDTDGLYFNLTGSEFRDEHDQYSAELQVSGASERLDYSAGVFALVEKAESLPTRSPIQNEVLYSCGCFFPPNSRPRPRTVRRDLTTVASAAYAQATYRLTGRLSGTLGGRLSHEKKKIRADILLSDPDTLEPTDSVFATGANRGDWRSITYRAGLEYQAIPTVMAYGSIAKGFKAGGFNVRPAAHLPNAGLATFKPETALTFELGLRSEWLERKFRANATVFYTSYKDIQLRRQLVVGGNIETLIDNAARAKVHGAELELMVKPARNLTLTAAYGYLAPKYLDTGTVPDLTTAMPFQRTPRHSGALTIHFEHPASWGTIEVDSNLSFRSKEQFQLLPREHDQKAYGLLGARFTFRSPSRGFSVAIFGTNLTDTKYRTAGRGGVTDDGLAFSSVGMPRQFGIQADLAF